MNKKAVNTLQEGALAIVSMRRSVNKKFDRAGLSLPGTDSLPLITILEAIDTTYRLVIATEVTKRVRELKKKL